MRPSVCSGVVLAVVAVACGPTVSLDDPRPPPPASDSSTTLVLPSLETTATTGSTDSGTTSTSSGGGAATNGAAEEDDGPLLDVLGPSYDLPPPPMDVPMYGPCWEDGQCEPGLECVVMAYGKLIQYSICTRECVDPAVDCEPAPLGWSATCALHVMDGQLDVCAIACDEMMSCPGMTWCVELFGPKGESQLVCTA